jgi:hypothetical protein
MVERVLMNNQMEDIKLDYRLFFFQKRLSIQVVIFNRSPLPLVTMVIFFFILGGNHGNFLGPERTECIKLELLVKKTFTFRYTSHFFSFFFFNSGCKNKTRRFVFAILPDRTKKKRLLI